MALVQKQVTEMTFHDGVLRPAGSVITIDTNAVELKDNQPGLRDPVGVTGVPVFQAAIGPTGPSPDMPQTLPVGAIQTPSGYATADGSPLLGEGARAVVPADALDSSVADLTVYLASVNDEATLTQLRADEVAGKSRKGAIDAIDARSDALRGA